MRPINLRSMSIIQIVGSFWVIYEKVQHLSNSIFIGIIFQSVGFGRHDDILFRRSHDFIPTTYSTTEADGLPSLLSATRGEKLNL